MRGPSHAASDQIIDALGQKSAELIVGIGLDLRAGAKREAKKASYTVTKLARTH